MWNCSNEKFFCEITTYRDGLHSQCTVLKEIKYKKIGIALIMTKLKLIVENTFNKLKENYLKKDKLHAMKVQISEHSTM